MSPFIRRKSPGQIFISYRRDESAWPADQLFRRLAEHFGKDKVFKDIDSIDLGDDFVQVITRKIGTSHVLLALIGNRWLTVTGKGKKRRLDDTQDPVRLELETALKCKVRVIPILIDGARMPHAKELPASLAGLVRRQAFELSVSRFDENVELLLAKLNKIIKEMPTSPRPPTTDDQEKRGSLGLGVPAREPEVPVAEVVRQQSVRQGPVRQGRSNTEKRGSLGLGVPAREPEVPAAKVVRQQPVRQARSNALDISFPVKAYPRPPTTDDQEKRGLLGLGAPAEEPEVPVTEVVRQPPVRPTRSKRSGKR
jgi:hypothetical protein